MTECFFVSDLHGKIDRYTKLFLLIEQDKPDAVFIGGDLLPHFLARNELYDDFFVDYFFPNLTRLKELLKDHYPQIFLILGNDDARIEEEVFVEDAYKELFYYINQRKVLFHQHPVFGYSFVPPTPFQLKDWEKYDVSRYADPGCIHPVDGFRTTEPNETIEFATIQKDLEDLTRDEDLSKAIFLFHSPPYETFLDRAALDGMMVDHVPLDLHVGSIAMKKFIEEKQPLLTLHGHIHESTRLTGNWMQNIGRTVCFNAAHDGPELSVIQFTLEHPELAERILV
jgi:Icc-related predicted phosphoesterase